MASPAENPRSEPEGKQSRGLNRTMTRRGAIAGAASFAAGLAAWGVIGRGGKDSKDLTPGSHRGETDRPPTSEPTIAPSNLVEDFFTSHPEYDPDLKEVFKSMTNPALFSEQGVSETGERVLDTANIIYADPEIRNAIQSSRIMELAPVEWPNGVREKPVVPIRVKEPARLLLDFLSIYDPINRSFEENWQDMQYLAGLRGIPVELADMVMHLGHMAWVEHSGRYPWSIKDYPLPVLIDGLIDMGPVIVLKDGTKYGGVNLAASKHGWVELFPFMANLLQDYETSKGSPVHTQEEAIGVFLDWARKNFEHTVSPDDDEWDSSFPGATEIIQRRIATGPMMLSLITGIGRSVNIPIKPDLTHESAIMANTELYIHGNFPFQRELKTVPIESFFVSSQIALPSFPMTRTPEDIAKYDNVVQRIANGEILR